MTALKLSREEKHWVLYDVGNSAFILLLTTILPILSTTLAQNEGYTVNQATSVWGYISSASTLLFVLLGPIMGAFADIRDRKKVFFMTFVFIGVAACALSGITSSWIFFLAAVFIAKIGFNGSLVFYDSMLTDTTTDDRVDLISSYGYAYGYIGSCIPFVLGLAFVMLCEDQLGIIPISFQTAALIALLTTAVWWVVFTVPICKSYKQRFYVEKPKHPIKDTLSHIGGTIRNIGKNKAVFWFLVAYFFFIDGVYTIMELATPYGLSMGIGQTHLLLALLLTQIVAFPCAIAFGRLAKKYKPRKMLLCCILIYLGISAFAFQLDKAWEFWALAVMVGSVQGGIQALSRSYYARIIPKNHSNEFFGFFDIFGKGATVIGTFLMGLIIQLTDKPNLGVIPIAVMFAIGFAVLYFMPKTVADE